MPTAPVSGAPDEPTEDDPKDVAALEKLRAKLARHNREAEQLGEAMRQKPTKN